MNSNYHSPLKAMPSVAKLQLRKLKYIQSFIYPHINKYKS